MSHNRLKACVAVKQNGLCPKRQIGDAAKIRLKACVAIKQNGLCPKRQIGDAAKISEIIV